MQTECRKHEHMRCDCIPVRSTGAMMSLNAAYPDCGLWRELGGGHG